VRSTIPFAFLCAAAAAGCGSSDPAQPDAAPASADAARAETGVVLSYREGAVVLDRAYFGYERAGGEVTELYFELSRGGEDGCPSPEAGLPDQILTVSGFAGAEPASRSFEDGVRVNFFDFTGELRDEVPPAAATAASIQLVSLDHQAGTASATADITFDDGTAVGPLHATHCDSLDGES
jgi:hypothetical protein